MKYSFGQMKAYLANRRGATSFSSLTSQVQSEALVRLNSLYASIWFHKNWGFSMRNTSIATLPVYEAGTVSGSAGSKIVTGTLTSWTSCVSGVPMRGQPILIGSHLYRIATVASTTKIVLESALLEDITNLTYKIYFAYYPTRWDVRELRSISVDNSDPVSSEPESAVSFDIEEGTSEIISASEKTRDDHYNTGTVTIASASNQATFNGATLTNDMIGMALLEKTNYQIYYIVDVNTGTGVATLDRKNAGSAVTGATYAINPEGTPMVYIKPFPVTRQKIDINYTYEPPKLINDNDMTLLPNDIPMMVGIDMIVTKWETVGERGFINEVMFQDKKFMESLKLLNSRLTTAYKGLKSLQQWQNRKTLRNSNPWNMWR